MNHLIVFENLDANENHVLIDAIQKHDNDFAKQLIDGVDDLNRTYNYSNTDGWTLLLVAVYNNNLEILKY